MIILRQREFGNKENKAAKRAYELQQGKKYIRGLKLDKDEAEKSALGMYRFNNDYDYQFPEEIKNVNQSINYKSRHAKRFEKELHSDDSKKSDLDKVVDRGVAKNMLDSEFGARGSLEKIKDKGKKYKRNLKFNKAKRDISKFVKDNKKGLAIGGAALGTAALVGGGIALHKHNKKKREEEEKKKSN